ncbi:MAG: domain disease resistance protein [Hymenobacter sp.]|jgi:Leucine-rich repeat (LRR) protein|nr:domain disease resistance protein [Hymenobacter sp.]
MRLSIICLLVLLAIAACQPEEKSVKTENKSAVIPNWKLPGVEAENERYWFCSYVDTAFQHPLSVKTLNLRDSIGAEDAKRLIAGLPKLRNLNTLWFSNQRNLNLEPFLEALQTSDSLQELMISGCKVNLLGKISNLKHLRKLVLQENNMRKVPISFLNFLNLESLTIRDYDTPFRFTGKLRSNNSLKELWISGCSEKDLNSEIYRLTNLRRLSVYESALESISPDIKSLKSLEELMVARCPLSGDENALIALRNQLHGKCSVKTEQDIPLPD